MTLSAIFNAFFNAIHTFFESIVFLIATMGLNISDQFVEWMEWSLSYIDRVYKDSSWPIQCVIVIPYNVLRLVCDVFRLSTSIIFGGLNCFANQVYLSKNINAAKGLKRYKGIGWIPGLSQLFHYGAFIKESFKYGLMHLLERVIYLGEGFFNLFRRSESSSLAPLYDLMRIILFPFWVCIDFCKTLKFTLLLQLEYDLEKFKEKVEPNEINDANTAVRGASTSSGLSYGQTPVIKL